MPAHKKGRGRVKAIIDAFTSTRTVLLLFALLICFLVPVTLFTESISTLLVPVKIILAIIGLNLIVCSITRFSRLRVSTLIIHLGSIIILIGGLISSFGFVATINIYEGSSIDTVFRWDIKQDVPLGFDLKVGKINFDFYPVPVRIGIVKNGVKADLIETRTGDLFTVEDYTVQVLSFEPFSRAVRLAVQSVNGVQVGTLSTSGNKDVSPGFPLDFKLVAYQDPIARRMWVELEVLKGGESIASGTSEVNEPLKWDGMQFFLTRVSADESGRPYAGIQISKDPGLPVVYSGIGILCLGLLLALKRWVVMSRKPAVGSKQPEG